MKCTLALVCLALFATLPLRAQDASPSGPAPTVQEVMHFFDIMDLRTQMQSMLQAQQKQMKASFGDMFGKTIPNATPKEREQFVSIMDSTMSDLYANYPIDDILRDMVPIYQKHLTESDLNAMIAFYASPVGKKVLREMPAMTSEAMRVSFARFQPKIEEVMKNMQSKIEQMAAAEKGSTTSTTGDAAPKSPAKQ